MDSKYHRTITDWYREQFLESYFAGAAGVRIRYAHSRIKAGRPVLVMALGRTEFIEKYHEVCWDLRHEDFSLCLYDHCGQGKSGRLLSDPEKGHIDTFGTYVADLKTLIETRVRTQTKGPLILLGYSMGGTVGLLFALSYPGLVDRLILASPMLQINTGWYLPPSLVETASRIMERMGKGECYVWGGGPFDAEMAYAGNVLTSDEHRFLLNRELMGTIEGVRLGSPTFRWMCEAYLAMREVRKSARRIRCPVAIHKGENDLLVSRSAMETFSAALPGCRMIRYREARHELLMEKNHIRAKVLEDIRGFISQSEE